VPPPQQIYYGGPRSIRMEVAGAQTIAAGGKSTLADHLLVHLKGSNWGVDSDMFFARDPARIPLSIKVPLSAGAFTLELVR
jgi:hypothetical protein